ncbi:IS630 family transposase, partial [Allofrancisella guangzhouensis]|nr:IS630 family transposase [Allofrancisella guangzhouensis]
MKGTRPRKVKQKQFVSSYIYAAGCAATGDSFGLILPETN